MPQARKHTTTKASRGKSAILPRSKAVIVINTIVPANETLFPEKLQKVNQMLRRVKWMA